jgi:hypothetical protein
MEMFQSRGKLGEVYNFLVFPGGKGHEANILAQTGVLIKLGRAINEISDQVNARQEMIAGSGDLGTSDKGRCTKGRQVIV